MKYSTNFELKNREQILEDEVANYEKNRNMKNLYGTRLRRLFLIMINSGTKYF